MISLMLIFAFFAVLVLLAAFVWLWWVIPRHQVPPHFTEAEFRRLEVQDRIRQTNYQVLTALGLGATFLTTLFQFGISAQHWNAETAAKAAQERAAQYVAAVKQIDQAGSPQPDNDHKPAGAASAAGPAAVRTLYLLGSRYSDEYHQQAHDILSAYVLDNTRGKERLRASRECRNDFGLSDAKDRALAEAEDRNGVVQDREEGLPGVQAAMAALGDKQFARFRAHDEGRGCASQSQAWYKLKLEHVNLDDLDLSGLDLSCALMSQSRLHRVSLNGANLSNADLRGARLADFDIPDTPAATGTMHDLLYVAEGKGGPPQWKRYRCWASDLRGANLSHANLEGAALAGADLTNADLTGANLCRADISRVNLTGAKGLTKEMLSHACSGKPGSDEATLAEAQPVGGHNLPRIRSCEPHVCPYELASASDPDAGTVEMAAEPAPREWRGIALLNLIAISLIAVAVVAYQRVGAFAKSRLARALPDSTVTFPSRFPEKGLSYSRELFEAFVRTWPEAAREYRKPILFPLDVIVMILLTVAMAADSWIWFAGAGFHWPFAVLILPLAYLAADFVEDVRLASLLQQTSVSADAIASLKVLTTLKLAAIYGGIVQTVAALIVYLVSFLPPSG